MQPPWFFLQWNKIVQSESLGALKAPMEWFLPLLRDRQQEDDPQKAPPNLRIEFDEEER